MTNTATSRPLRNTPREQLTQLRREVTHLSSWRRVHLIQKVWAQLLPIVHCDETGQTVKSTGGEILAPMLQNGPN
ncbi:hypothetical protein BaRGS_00034605 [Batillaria attramentaria]|uniref:Uncharacterized protein n=1 Tax=Batillaria attramentaria TaxID=370345 RepID=A0ABD0JHA2_9CAEN